MASMFKPTLRLDNRDRMQAPLSDLCRHPAIAAEHKSRFSTMSKVIALLALTLEFALSATAMATAKSWTVPAPRHAIEDVTQDGNTISSGRVRALRECNARISRFKGYYSLITPTSIYRSCMAEHDQPE